MSTRKASSKAKAAPKSGLKHLKPTETLDFVRVSAALCRQAAKYDSATLHEAGGKIGALPSGIKPVSPKFRICGPAFTVQGPPVDNLQLHRAIASAQPGDVLVANVGGVYEAGYWGELMSTGAKARKLGGLVIDGCVRDGVLLRKIGFPIFARGLCIYGTGKDFNAQNYLNAPVLIGDITVHAGDLVMGDEDGVVVIPRDKAEEVIKAAAARAAKEAAVVKRLKKGENSMDIYGWNDR